MFKVECPGCRAPYQVDERRVPSTGLKMRCPKCTTSFKVDPPATGQQGGAVLGAALGGATSARAPAGAGAGTGTAASAQRRPGVTMLGVAPASGAPAAPSGVPAAFGSPPAAASAASVDLPSVAGKVPRADLPMALEMTPPLAGGAKAGTPALKGPPPVPRRARPTGPAPRGSEPEHDLPSPSPAHRTPKEPPPPKTREAKPAADLDLPSLVTLPPAAELPDVRASRNRSYAELELDLPSPSADLPVRGSTRPAARGTDLPVAAGAGLPLPAAGLPLVSTQLPAPSAGLPAPSASLPLPSASFPSSSAAFPSPNTSPTELGLPLDLGGLPSPSGRPPAANTPSAAEAEMAARFSLAPTSIGELDLPPVPPDAASFPPRSQFAEPSREHDPFGEAELPPPRSLRESETKLLSQPPEADHGVVRQEGGGTNYGEVNLGGDSGDLLLEAPSLPVSARSHEGTEFDAVPQEKGQLDLGETKPLAEAQPKPSLRDAAPRRTGMRVFIGVCVALASGGSLALLPDIGPFGAHWIVDRARSSEYEALLRRTTSDARKRFGADTASEAARAWNDAERARTGAKRMKPLAAHAAFVGYLRELRFGSASEVHARAGVLLDSLSEANDVAYLELARAARAATEGQLARARQSLHSILGRDGGNVDALVVSGEVELRARNTKAALEAWRSLQKLEQSARAAFGLARAEYWSGEVAAAENHAKQALLKNPSHVGARILLARIASGRPGQETSAISALEAVTAQPASASAEELVNANTLLGDVHLTRSRISRAEAAYAAALALDPKAPGALRGLGESLFRAGRYSEAQARFEAGAQADPDDLDAKVGVAKSKFMLERLEEARDSLAKLREAHPKSVLACYWHGRVLESMGERDQAEKAYRTAIQQKADRDPMLVESYIALAQLENQQGKPDAARGTLSAARERFPSTPAIHRALGDVALTQGRYTEAKTEFEQALALDPDDLATRFRLGVALRRDTKFDEAVRTFDAVAAVDPEFPGLALERGLLFEAAGKTEEALKQYEGARAKAPNDPDLMLRVGCGYAAAGRTKDAEELLRKVLALRPTSAETQHCLGRALLAEGSRLADALRLLERATELDPHRAEYYLYVGWAANEAGNMAKAQRALDEAIKLDQGLADAYWQRGVLRSRQSSVRDAIADLTRALALRPTRYEAHAALADAYYDLGKEPLALKEWAKAVEAQPDNATWRFRYGKLLAANHRSELARSELSRALELVEKNPRGERWLWEAHHLLARVLGARPEAVPHWEAFLKLGPLDSPYRAEAKSALERLGRPWTGN